MNICNDWSHEEIVHMESECPLCKACSKITELEEELEELKEAEQGGE